MGTGKSGRYLSTQSGGRSVSDYAAVHSLEGTFTYDSQGHISRMKSGGHGQENMEILDKAGISYTVIKTYDNGVRIGNVSKHKNPTNASKVVKLGFQEDGPRRTSNVQEVMSRA